MFMGRQTPPYISSSVPKEWEPIIPLQGPERASILNPLTFLKMSMELKIVNGRSLFDKFTCPNLYMTE